jgi:hypothetical protein
LAQGQVLRSRRLRRLAHQPDGAFENFDPDAEGFRSDPGGSGKWRS